MEPIYIKPEGLSPGVILDKEKARFEINGISCSVNAFEFYIPIFKWFDRYIENPLMTTILDLKLVYFNTASAKLLLNMMNRLSSLTFEGYNFRIRWYYSEEDEDMKEEGEEYADMLDIEFEIIPIKNESDNSEDDDYFESLLCNL